MKKFKTRVLSALLISSILCLTGCEVNNPFKKEEEATEDKRITVNVEKPANGSISIDGDFIGTVESEEQVYVMSKLSGDVTDTFFEVGDYVNEGDLMFTIDDTAAQISYKQASAALTSANASLNTAKAGVNTANANVNAQTASVTESFAKASTTDKQLQIAIDSANVNYANAEVSIGSLEDTIDGLNDKISSLEEKVDNFKSGKRDLEAAYAVALAQGDTSRAEDLAEDIAASEISISELNSTIESLKSTKSQTKASLQTAKNSQCLLVENGDLARAQKSDYDNYTKATIGNGGLATLASAQAGVIQAEAGVTQSKAGITQAQAGVDAAKLQLDYSKVSAPVSGIVTAKNVTKNNMTSTGSIAYTIQSDGTKYVTFYVSEDVMKELFEGQSISIDRNGNVYDAVITDNPGIADPANGLFKIKAKVNSSEDLINGVKVKITMATKHSDNVMTLPIDAVYHESEKSYVYVYKDDKANKVYIEPGLFDDTKIEIISGLTGDEQVITTWSSQLRNGVEVKTENSVSSNDTNSGNIAIERN